ncbi:MAG: MATE family efflux transporter [Oscillospiraceae bacterium]|nr:MATE family efflux transporter [Oscillospiraceae bacterium]
MAKTYDLTNGSPAKLIMKFFFPMFFTNMLQQIYTIADTAIVGKGLGDDQLAAVGNMSSLTFLIVGFSIGLTNGFSIMTAQYFGAGNKKNLRQCVAASAVLAFSITAVLTLLSIIFLRPVLVLLQTPESIISDSLIYGYIIFGGLAANIAYNLCASILRALGDSKTPFYAIIVSTITNIIFDFVFVFGLKTGVEGPAAVTVMSQLVSAVICFARIRKIEILQLSKDDFRNTLSMAGNLLKNGIPMAAMNSITAVGCMTVQYFVNGMGVVYTSAYSACSKYINLFMQPACTAGYTMSSFTSQNCGAEKYDRIVSGLKVCLSVAAVSYIILGSVMVFFSGKLASFMLNGPEQIGLASIYLVRCGIMIFAVDFLFVFRSGCQGMGKPFLPMISGVLEMIMRVLVIALFIGKIGFAAAAYAEIAAWCAALAINVYAFVYFIRKKTKHDKRKFHHFAIRILII